MNSQRFFSIRYKFTIFFLCAIFVPIFLISVVYFIRSSEIIQDKFSTSNLINIKQTGYNIDFVLNDAHRLTLDLIKDPTIYEFLKNTSDRSFTISDQSRLSLEGWLYYLSEFNVYIDSIYIKSKNGIELDTKSTRHQISSAFERQIKLRQGGYLWHANELVNYDGTKTPVLSITRVINDFNNVTKELGMLEISISEPKLANIYKNNLLNSSGEFMIINEHNRIISSANKERMYQPTKQHIFQRINNSNAKYGKFIAAIGRNKVLVTYFKLANTNWALVNNVPIADLLKETRAMRNQLAISILGIFLIFSLLTVSFLDKFLSPLKTVRKVMRQLQAGNFDVRLDFQGNDEIALLGNSFNQMSAKLKELMHQVYMVKIKQKEAELNALQAQINPHFLYNTLDTIYWMSRMEKALETSQLVQALSKLFRLSLNQGKEFTTVEKELAHLNNYIFIQKKRYEGLIHFSVDVAADLLNLTVIKLILQPLVENAIYHGIEPKGQNGEIQIRIYREADFLFYRVNDNGVGTDAAKIQALLSIPYEQKTDFGFALKNVNDRLKLYYGEAYGISFTSTPGAGTVVIVKQPIINGKEANTDDKTLNCR